MKPPIHILSDAIRGCIIASEGKRLAVADYANIEGRIAAWLPGEEWKIQAFRDFDAGTGPDLYCVSYGKSFSIPATEVTKAQRQIGKVQELALQYGGGAAAFQTFANTFGINLADLADQAWDVIPESKKKSSESLYLWQQKQDHFSTTMSQREWTVCDAFKSMWRESHPAIVEYWATLQKCVEDAIENKGDEFQAGPCTIDTVSGWLRIQLPSGRYLCYPKIKKDENTGVITYQGTSQFTKQWVAIKSYGPKFFENIVQAIARDILCEGMLHATRAGFEVVLTVHDEIIAEHESLTSHELCDLMTILPEWAMGLPLAVEGFTTDRYRK